MILYILLAILMLGVLIAVHEFGHFISARLCGIEVKEFSIGVGPKLYQRTVVKTGMKFSIRCIPFGGYCMFYGDTDDDPTGEKQEDPRSYSRVPVWKRIISMVSGPLMNVLLAFLLAILLCAVYGGAADCPQVASITPHSAAEECGLLPGDRFSMIAGEPMDGLSANEAAAAISRNAGESPLELVVIRDGESVELSAQPRFDPDEGRYLIGVSITTAVRPYHADQLFTASFELCKSYVVGIAESLFALFTRGEGFENTSGPVGVVQIVAEQTRAYGFLAFLQLCVFISINLGIVNLLPIPGLDGCRILFALIEIVRGKPMKQSVEAIIHLCGYGILLLLMLYFTFNDVLRIFK